MKQVQNILQRPTLARQSLILGLLLAPVLLLMSCNSSTVGLFYSLENVVPIVEEGRGLDANAPIKSFSEGTQNYYLTTSVLKVRKQNVNDSGTTGYTWKNVDLPSGMTTALKVAFDSGTVYLHASVDGATATATGLYSIPEFTYENAGSLTWTRFTPAYMAADERISDFFLLNGVLFVELHDVPTDGSPGGYRIVDDASGNEVIARQQFPIVAAAYDSATVNWFVTTNSIYYITDANVGSTAASSVDLTAAAFLDGSSNPLYAVDTISDTNVFGFSGVDSPSANEVYVSTYGGYVFYTTDGSTWNAFKKGGSTGYRFENEGSYTQLATITLVSSSFGFSSPYTDPPVPSDELFAGSQNEGYVILDPANEAVTYYDPQNDINTTNLSSTSLYRSNISRIVYATNENVIFALTPAEGLWRGAMENNQLIWKKE